MSRLIIGIDNGLRGGVVGLDADGKVVLKEIAPIIPGDGKNIHDIAAMARILRGLEDVVVYLEKAQAFAKQGVTSTFSTGFGFGVWSGILVALNIPCIIVPPKTWQKVMFAGINHDDTKQASAYVATHLHPDVDWRATERSRVVSDGLSDAFCIAEWGRRQEKRLA